jgi:DNA processing protein
VHAAVAQVGSLEEALEPTAIPAWALAPPAAIAVLEERNDEILSADLRWLESSGATLIPCTSAHYPPLLKQTIGAPPAIYVQGNAALLSEPQLAMVGSRTPTPTGRATARDFARFFARCGLTITSGLALGIDGASHEGALAGGGTTIAVCGTGLNRVYPKTHRKLADRIRAHGALVSEFPPDSPPLRPYFPQRNRIISGLALGTLVVEATSHSGSLITARYAADQGRDVFAIPGSIHSALSQGCHQLIREGAKLVERGEDVLVELKFSLNSQALAGREDRSVSGPALDKEYEMLLDALGFEPTGIDALVERTGLPSESVASMLLILELEGRVAPHAGGLFCRLPKVS